MDIRAIFQSKAHQLLWRAIDPSRVVGGLSAQSFDKGQCYFVVRATEMYLASCRKLWKQVNPVLHSWVRCGGNEQHMLAGPAQLSQLGDSNLNRIADFDEKLAGPLPYTGEDITILAGLYSVPGYDLATSLIATAFSLVTRPDAAALSGLAKKTIEGLLGIDSAALHLGIQQTFSIPARPLRPGYWLAIAAHADDIDMSQLWISDGRLVKGVDPATAKSYEEHDYILLSIERQDVRDDWPALIASQQENFERIVADAQSSLDDKRKRLAAAWLPFIETLAGIPALTAPDRDRIAKLVSDSVLAHLHAAGEGNPFSASK